MLFCFRNGLNVNMREKKTFGVCIYKTSKNSPKEILIKLHRLR